MKYFVIVNPHTHFCRVTEIRPAFYLISLVLTKNGWYALLSIGYAIVDIYKVTVEQNPVIAPQR